MRFHKEIFALKTEFGQEKKTLNVHCKKDRDSIQGLARVSVKITGILAFFSIKETFLPFSYELFHLH